MKRRDCDFTIVRRVDLAHVIDAYEAAYLHGRHGELPTSALTQRLVERGQDWVLASVPIDALNYQDEQDSGSARIERAKQYATKRIPFPPGVAVYGGRGRQRRTGRAYVIDGNHRVLAAQYRGDCAVRMFMPTSEYDALVADARHDHPSTVREHRLRETAEEAWYHGSPHRFDRFHRRTGRTFGSDESEVPIFLTHDLKFARLYAGANGFVYTVNPLVNRTFDANTFVLSDRYWPPPRESLSPEGQEFYDDLAGNKIFPDLIGYGTKTEDDDEWRAMHDSYGTYASILSQDYDVMETTEMKRWLLAHGYDSFLVRGDGPTNLAVFDPEKIEILSSERV
jgi:hypothetical protein